MIGPAVIGCALEDGYLLFKNPFSESPADPGNQRHVCPPFPFIKKSRSFRGLCDRESTQCRFSFWGGPFFDSETPHRHSPHSVSDSEASALTGPHSPGEIKQAPFRALARNCALHCALDPFQSAPPWEHPTSVYINTYRRYWAAGALVVGKVQLQKTLTLIREQAWMGWEKKEKSLFKMACQLNLEDLVTLHKGDLTGAVG